MPRWDRRSSHGTRHLFAERGQTTVLKRSTLGPQCTTFVLSKCGFHTPLWGFPANKPDSPLLRSDDSLAYPPSRARPNPRDDGSDLVGRNFVEPELGVCVIIGPGPVTTKHLSTRAQTARVRKDQEPAIKAGSHYTLRYQHTESGEEHFSSVDEILHWISTGPLLSPPSVPVSQNDTNAPITTPPYITATIQFVPTEPQPITPSPVTLTLPTTQQHASRRDQRVASPSITAARDQSKEQRVASAAQKRVSEGGSISLVIVWFEVPF